MVLTLLSQISRNGQTHSNNFVGNLPTNCLTVFDNFVGLVLKGLILLDALMYKFRIKFISLNQFSKRVFTHKISCQASGLTGMKFHPRIKKKEKGGVNTSSPDETLK